MSLISFLRLYTSIVSTHHLYNHGRARDQFHPRILEQRLKTRAEAVKKAFEQVRG